MQAIDLKCPACGADILADKDRESIFCAYCGTKVFIKDENTFTQRHVDEAEVIRAETERMLQMHRIEEAKKAKIEEKRRKKVKTIVSIVWISFSVLLCLISAIIGFATGSLGAVFFVFFGAFSLIGFLIYVGYTSNAATEDEAVEREIEITEDLLNLRGEDVDEVAAWFEEEGFHNIKKEPIYDLTFLKKKRQGTVKSISINGQTDFDEGDVFLSSSVVIITYHAMPVKFDS